MKMLLMSYLIYGDINKLNQVLRNLISNALKFTSKGGNVEITIRTKNCKTNDDDFYDTLIISVKDSGPGISIVS